MNFDYSIPFQPAKNYTTAIFSSLSSNDLIVLFQLNYSVSQRLFYGSLNSILYGMDIIHIYVMKLFDSTA